MTGPAIQSQTAEALPDYAPVPASAFGPAPNAQGYYVGQVERNLYWVTDGVYQLTAVINHSPDGNPANLTEIVGFAESGPVKYTTTIAESN